MPEEEAAQYSFVNSAARQRRGRCDAGLGIITRYHGDWLRGFMGTWTTFDDEAVLRSLLLGLVEPGDKNRGVAAVAL